MLCQALMRTGVVIVDQVFTQHTPKVRLVDNQQLVETFLAYRSHPALGICVGVRGVKGCVDDLNVLGTKEGVERFGKLGIIVVDQKVNTWRPPFQLPEDLPCLLTNPA